MIFPKHVIAESLDFKLKKQFQEIHPWETAFKEGDKSPFEHYIMNFYTFFDLKSNPMKDLMYQARKEAVKDCFNKPDMSLYPNEEKIRNCVSNAANKRLEPYYNKRNLYFGNGK